MRIGFNPNNHSDLNILSTSHRVIIPVYIPNNTDYFADSLNVFKVCMASLLKTINSDTAITIISNGSSAEVNNFINELQYDKKIDRVIFNTQNIGKINSIVAEARACSESYITFADADVFFDKDWLKQTYSIFKNFPKAGYVSTNPVPDGYGFATATLLDNFFNGKLKSITCDKIIDRNDLFHFHKSIGRDKQLTDSLLNKKIAYLENEICCFIGAGHFCCTIKKETILKFVPKTQANLSGAEKEYLDMPTAQSGLWILSSIKSYVYHLGNVLEKDWAQNKLDTLDNYNEKNFRFNELKFENQTLTSYLIPKYVKKLIVKLLKKYFIEKNE